MLKAKDAEKAKGQEVENGDVVKTKKSIIIKERTSITIIKNNQLCQDMKVQNLSRIQRQ